MAAGGELFICAAKGRAARTLYAALHVTFAFREWLT